MLSGDICVLFVGIKVDSGSRGREFECALGSGTPGSFARCFADSCCRTQLALLTGDFNVFSSL